MTDQRFADDNAAPQSPFEQIKRIDPDGNEFWSARDLLPLLEFASWQNFEKACEEIYSSFCMENNKQLAITRQPCFVTIGSNAVREVTDFHINYVALERLLGRIASHKPEAMRQLRNQNIDRYRFEIDIGAILFDFCETAHITIAHQKIIGQYKYDYCTAERLLIEVDEKQHQYLLSQRRIDKLKDELAEAHGYKLLRISVPCTNVAKLCGTIASELVIISQLGLNSVQTS